ncbi:MAG: purine permease [Pseudomonas sp.]|nr:purine permease [Pseudomonas sp.]MBB52225.1 purine permease [Pseudomonadales bacterium]
MRRTLVTNDVRGIPMLLMAFQHVMVMYAGAVAIPLVLGAALGLSKSDIAFLINADLFACGIVTIIQALGIGPVGIRMPVMMGVTFTAIGPMIAIGSDPAAGLSGIFGATIAAGLFGLAISPLVGKLLRFFPPVVTGTEIVAVGLSLMSVAAAWSAGGFGNESFGDPLYLAIACAVLICILLIVRYTSGFVSNISVLVGLVFGFSVSAFAGLVSLEGIQDAPAFGFIMPFHFGLPTFHLWPIAAMCIVMLVTFVESTGMFIALGEIVEKSVDERTLTRGFRADAVGTVVGGVFNTFPYTSYAQNIGLVGITGVRSPWVCAMAGVILIVLGLFPKVAYFVASIPPCVLGGAGIVMFGMVTASGMKVLGRVDFSKAGNLYIVAISLAVGMLPVVSPQFFSKLPSALSPILESPILLTAIVATALNIFFNGVRKYEAPEVASESNEVSA